MQNFANLSFYLIVGTVGGLIGFKLRFPGSILICAAVLVIIAKMITQSSWSAHGSFQIGIQILLGVLIGTRYNPEIGKMISQMTMPIITSTIVLVGVGLVFSIILARLGILDASTAYLSTSPGAMSALLTLSLGTDTQTTVLAAFHFFRVIFIILTAPLAFQLVNYLTGKGL